MKERLARQLAAQAAYKPGQLMRADEMRQLADALFGCTMPAIGPDGRPAFRQIRCVTLGKNHQWIVTLNPSLDLE
jgi:DNA mismatch repair ATPase MutL